MNRSNEHGQRVCIFWLMDARLIIDPSPLSEAEPYGDSYHASQGSPGSRSLWTLSRTLLMSRPSLVRSRRRIDAFKVVQTSP